VQTLPMLAKACPLQNHLAPNVIGRIMCPIVTFHSEVKVYNGCIVQFVPFSYRQ